MTFSGHDDSTINIVLGLLLLLLLLFRYWIWCQVQREQICSPEGWSSF